MTFTDCVVRCANDREFVSELERLRERRFCFAHPRTELERMIDESSGRAESDLAVFSAIVADLVWARLPADAFMAPEVQP